MQELVDALRWHDAELEQPPTDGERVFVGLNENGYAGCFNSVGNVRANQQCYMAGPEETVTVMGGLKWWRELDRPAPPSLLPDLKIEPGAYQAVAALTDEERVDLFCNYCHGCGRPVGPHGNTCHCENDE